LSLFSSSPGYIHTIHGRHPSSSVLLPLPCKWWAWPIDFIPCPSPEYNRADNNCRYAAAVVVAIWIACRRGSTEVSGSNQELDAIAVSRHKHPICSNTTNLAPFFNLPESRIFLCASEKKKKKKRKRRQKTYNAGPFKCTHVNHPEPQHEEETETERRCVVTSLRSS
jgi:hypothetical protein